MAKSGVAVGERIDVILFHMRRSQGAASKMKLAAAHLTGADFQKLQDVLNMIEKKSEIEYGPLSLVKREGNDDERQTQKKGKSAASIDSEGFPNCFNSPRRQAKWLLHPKRFRKKTAMDFFFLLHVLYGI